MQLQLGLSEIPRRTYLTKSCYKVCIFSLILVTVLQILIWIDHRYSSTPICNSDIKFDKWTWYAQFLQVGFFCLNFWIQNNRIMWCNYDYDDYLSAYIANICVTVIAGGSSILTIIWDWGGICEDRFGVRTPAAIWAEWVVAVPLLLYISMAIEDKQSLHGKEIVIIISAILVFVFGFLQNLQISVWLCAVFFILSMIAYGVMLFYLIFLHTNKLRPQPIIEDMSTVRRSSSHNKLRWNLSLILCLFTPTFVIAYILCMAKIINSNELLVAYSICNTSTKVVFAAMSLDMHLYYSHKSVGNLFLLNQNMQTKEAFFSGAHTGLKASLNTIRMGIKSLSASNLLRSNNFYTSNHDTETESLLVIQNASTIIDETLQDMMSVKFLLNQEISLDSKKVFLRELINSVVLAYQADITRTSTIVHVSIHPSVPICVAGDGTRIMYVMAIFIHQMLKIARVGSNLMITVKNRISDNTILESENNVEFIDFSIVSTDNIEENNDGSNQRYNLDSLFNQHSYRLHHQHQYQLRLSTLNTSQHLIFDEVYSGDDLQTRIKLCEKIITLHGGWLKKTTVFDHNVNFGFIIPFKVISMNRRPHPPPPPPPVIEMRGRTGGDSRDRYIEKDDDNNVIIDHNHYHHHHRHYSEYFHHEIDVDIESDNNTNSNSRSDRTVPANDRGGGILRQVPLPTTSGSGNSLTRVVPVAVSDDIRGTVAANIRSSIATTITDLEPSARTTSLSSLPIYNTIPSSSVPITTSSIGLGIVGPTDRIIEEYGDGDGSGSGSGSGGSGKVSSEEDPLGKKFVQLSQEDLEIVKVLIVDDISTLFRMTNMLLKKNNCISDQATDHHSAVTAIRNKYYDLVFVNSLCTRQSGVKIVESLRKNGFANIIIGYTGSMMENECNDFLTSGADNVMQMPIKFSTISLLLSYVRRFGPTSRHPKYLYISESKKIVDWTNDSFDDYY